MTRQCLNPACARDLNTVPALSGRARYCNESCRREAWRARSDRAEGGQKPQKVLDVDRVLRALQDGLVSPMDFDAPRVVDGLKPIRRVAARICDLRKEGYEITTTRRPDGTAVYKLDGQPTAGERPEGASPTAAVTNPRPHADAAVGRSPLPADSALFDPEQYTPATSHYEEAARLRGHISTALDAAWISR